MTTIPTEILCQITAGKLNPGWAGHPLHYQTSPVLLIWNLIFFQPFSRDALIFRFAVTEPLIFQAQSANRVSKAAKRTPTMNGRFQLRAAGALLFFSGEVLHHAPLIDMGAIGQF